MHEYNTQFLTFSNKTDGHGLARSSDPPVLGRENYIVPVGFSRFGFTVYIFIFVEKRYFFFLIGLLFFFIFSRV